MLNHNPRHGLVVVLTIVCFSAGSALAADIYVTTTADTNANMPLRGFTNGTMQVSAQMMKEY